MQYHMKCFAGVTRIGCRAFTVSMKTFCA